MIIKKFHYINFYDDEGADFYIRTNIPTNIIKDILQKYRNNKIKGYNDVLENGYNYTDFFNILTNLDKQYIVEYVDCSSYEKIYF